MSGDVFTIPFSEHRIHSISPQTRDRILAADVFIFDVDSTIIASEGINDLADFVGKGDRIKEITHKAMCGTLCFDKALQERIQILELTYGVLSDFMSQYTFEYTPFIKDLFQHLRSIGKPIRLVSGGFEELLSHILGPLAVAPEDLYANTLLFQDGKCVGYDSSRNTSKQGGKKLVIEEIMEKNGFSTAVMVGDGITDAEAKSTNITFVGYGGVARRPAVEALSDWYIHSHEELLLLLSKYHGDN